MASNQAYKSNLDFGLLEACHTYRRGDELAGLNIPLPLLKEIQARYPFNSAPSHRDIVACHPVLYSGVIVASLFLKRQQLQKRFVEFLRISSPLQQIQQTLRHNAIRYRMFSPREQLHEADSIEGCICGSEFVAYRLSAVDQINNNFLINGQSMRYGIIIGRSGSGKSWLMQNVIKPAVESAEKRKNNDFAFLTINCETIGSADDLARHIAKAAGYDPHDWRERLLDNYFFPSSNVDPHRNKVNSVLQELDTVCRGIKKEKQKPRILIVFNNIHVLTHALATEKSMYDIFRFAKSWCRDNIASVAFTSSDDSIFNDFEPETTRLFRVCDLEESCLPSFLESMLKVPPTDIHALANEINKTVGRRVTDVRRVCEELNRTGTLDTTKIFANIQRHNLTAFEHALSKLSADDQRVATSLFDELSYNAVPMSCFFAGKVLGVSENLIMRLIDSGILEFKDDESRGSARIHFKKHTGAVTWNAIKEDMQQRIDAMTTRTVTGSSTDC
eukprot:GILK01015490.1.p1 GENE.GILK01015490.1~~GILK01015490.1.p1  ORF type:complete len:502 (-),score=61.59 GILK01015490.1:57-1562(-)